MKFPFSSCVVLTFIGIDPRVVSRGEVWENREAFERLEMARFDEDYMTELRLMHSELVAEERQLLEMYQKGLPTRLGPPSAVQQLQGFQRDAPGCSGHVCPVICTSRAPGPLLLLPPVRASDWAALCPGSFAKRLLGDRSRRRSILTARGARSIPFPFPASFLFGKTHSTTQPHLILSPAPRLPTLPCRFPSSPAARLLPRGSPLSPAPRLPTLPCRFPSSPAAPPWRQRPIRRDDAAARAAARSAVNTARRRVRTGGRGQYGKAERPHSRRDVQGRKRPIQQGGVCPAAVRPPAWAQPPAVRPHRHHQASQPRPRRLRGCPDLATGEDWFDWFKGVGHRAWAPNIQQNRDIVNLLDCDKSTQGIGRVWNEQLAELLWPEFSKRRWHGFKYINVLVRRTPRRARDTIATLS
ncbi:uncharacterized protein [Triticum aestivum]|uniref:uncharacterized protein n=1 Tax=Triticum aestivum TaxID=4565 RepID=UPI001D013FE6|nr:uncharacterized protein LOC123174947 [Triticum aestivum]